jgi:hypothetical protein
MKSFLPLQFPETTNPTSLHGVPVRSKPIAGSVSRAKDRHRSHGAPARRLTLLPVSRAKDQPLHRFPARRICYAARFPERNNTSNPAVLPHTSSSLRRSGRPARRCALVGTGCSSSCCRCSLPGCPNIVHQPHCARSAYENDAFAQFPVRSRRPQTRLPMLGGTHSEMVAHSKCFLGTQSPACRAGRGATISPHGCPWSANVANGDLIFSRGCPRDRITARVATSSSGCPSDDAASRRTRSYGCPHARNHLATTSHRPVARVMRFVFAPVSFRERGSLRF